MKLIKPLFILTTLSFLLSCGFISDSTSSRSDDDIKVDLSDVALLIPAIEAGLEFVDEESAITDRSYSNDTRAISPGLVTDDGSGNMAKYFGSDWDTLPKSPDEVFTDNSDEVINGVLRIPETGYISGLYSNSNNEFYMTMESESDTEPLYRIKLYMYPLDVFNIDYTYEEYFVNEDDDTVGSWDWSWFDNSGEYQKLAKGITYYRDGSYIKRDSTSYEAFYDDVKSGAPDLDDTIDTLLGDYTDYIYPDDSPLFTTSTGTYSSKSTGTIKGTNLKQDVEEYYTEEDTDADSVPDYLYSVLYMESSKRNDSRENVTRYITDMSDDENVKTNILSVNTNGDYYTEMNWVYKEADSYSSERHIWDSSLSSSLDVSNAISVITELTQDDSDNTIYTGEVEAYWGSSGINYNYSLDTETGEISYSWIGIVTRSLGSDSIDLTDLENITIGSSSSSWSFTGSYQLGELYGTYSYDGTDYEVIMDLEGVEIEGEFYNWTE